MESLALLLEMSRISSVSSLLGLWWRKCRSRGRVSCRAWSSGLRQRWAGSIGNFRVTKRLQVITATLLIALLGAVVLLTLALV
jgi:hypothetical protein